MPCYNPAPMGEPVIVPRAEHPISRRDIDPDALKVLYRLHHHHFTAYLVGGSVRDLLLGRQPKDFDIGTSAHPGQIKKLFRNCWIIGRRFRLAHVKFGPKVIEVATFRRQVPAGTEEEPPLPHEGPRAPSAPIVHRDNTFGTPEEDAFRRDFTVNALFYDIGTFSVIDYVGGLEDLRARVIRSIGDPDVRFQEDPVRMLRALVLAARLEFEVDPDVAAAISRQGALIGHSAPPRLLEEFFKILRSGVARRAFHGLAESGLLAHISPEIGSPLPDALEESLDRLDEYRARHVSTPETLTNAVLLGSLIVPLGLLRRRQTRRDAVEDAGYRHAVPTLGALPLARRDVEGLLQILGLQRRLLDVDAPPRVLRGVRHRPAFPAALTWLDIHGHTPDVVARWRELEQEFAHPPHHPGGEVAAPRLEGRRRRRRRRGRPPV